MRRKESKQEEQRNMLFQLAITGLMAYFGMNKKKVNDDEGDGKPHAVQFVYLIKLALSKYYFFV
jgi:hypothetical protein